MSLQATGVELAEQGMAATLDKEPEQWLSEALEALQAFASKPEWSTFKLEDFRAWWLLNGGSEPHTHKCWGALTSRASKAKLIEATGRFATSVSPKTHGHPVRTWRLSRPELVLT